MRFAVTVISPPGHAHSAAFVEMAESLHYGLLSLGLDSVLTVNGDAQGRRYIVLGAELLPYSRVSLPDDAILYNLEQVGSESPWLRPEIIALFRRHTLWDYSEQNAERLAAMDVRVARIVPIGYVPELTRIERARAPDIDVLFFGSLNPRRRRVLAALRTVGLSVTGVFGAYGERRDALIARARLVLNVHFYEARVLEMVRISYLLANRCAVLAERSADPVEDQAIADGVAFSDYADLVRRARELIDAPEEREEIAQRGFDLMRARPTAEYLRQALAYDKQVA